MRTIDCRGLECPIPVVKVKNELEANKKENLTVIVDNQIAKENVTKFVINQGLNSEILEEDGIYYITINCTGTYDKKENDIKNDQTGINGDLVILVSSDKLGIGDDGLGTTLMKSYLYALGENGVKPKTIIFLNGGVKLTCEGSEVVESLKLLISKGCEILSCGACLDFYGLKDKLLIGSITNMYVIVEKLNSANNTIKI